MSNGVEFEGDNAGIAQKMQSVSPGQGSSSNSKFGQWLMNKGIVKTESGAQTVLVAIVIMNVIITLFVIIYLL